MGKRVSVIDPVKTLVEHLRQVVGRSQEKDHPVGTCRLYVTALDEQILRVSRSLFFGRFSLELLDESGH